jgi:hypothetical protein
VRGNANIIENERENEHRRGADHARGETNRNVSSNCLRGFVVTQPSTAGYVLPNGVDGKSDIEHVALGSRRIDGQAAEGRGAELGKRSINTSRSREWSFWAKRHRR